LTGEREAVTLVPTDPPAAVALTSSGPTDHDPLAVYLARLGAGSRRTMAAALESVAELLTGGEVDAMGLPWWELRYQHTQAIRAALIDEGYAPATIRKTLSAVRGVLQEAWRLGLMPADDYHRAVDLPTVPGERLPAGRGLAAGELRALFAACDPTPSRALDAAVLALLYGAGLRRAEAVAADLTNYQPDDGALVVTAPKGGRQRRVFLTGGARAAVDAWLTHRGTTPGPLLSPVRKDGVITVRRMSPDALYRRLQRLGATAGIARFTPHDLRRSFVSDLLDAGADLAAVQALAGHRRPETTSRYDRRPDTARRKIATLLHVPYTPSS
jgi:integrase